MNEPFTWEVLRHEALTLEIKVHERDGHIFLLQCGSGQHIRFEEDLAGCQAAAVWLAEVRRAIDVRDQLRGLELPRRRRMLLRYLWRK